MEFTPPVGGKNTAANKPLFLSPIWPLLQILSDFLVAVYTVHMWKTICPVLCRSEVQKLGEKLGKIS